MTENDIIKAGGRNSSIELLRIPSFAKANVVFNYVTWFSILYVIASYIRLYPKEWFNSTKITGLLAGSSLLLSWGSIIVLAMLSRMVGKGIGLCYFFVADSNKILALTTGVRKTAGV